MKIGIDAREAQSQGSGKGRYTLQIIRALAKIDRRNSYFLFTPSPLRIALPDNFKLIKLPAGKAGWIFKYPKLVRRVGVDVFFSPTSFLVSALIPGKVVTVVHDLAVFLSSQARPALKTYVMEKLFTRAALRRSRHIIAVSENTKKDVVSYFKVKAEKITTTHLAVFPRPKAVNGPNAVKAKYKLPAKFFLFVGTVEPRKNVENILKAYALLPKGIRAAIPLVLAGKKGWRSGEIYKTAEVLGLHHQARFLGKVGDGDLPGLYQASVALVYPSWYEGFGLPVLEAMHFGTAVITSFNSSLSEVGGNAVSYVNPGSPKSIAEAMLQMVNDLEFRNKLITRGKKRAAEFSWRETAKKTLAVFEKVA